MIPLDQQRQLVKLVGTVDSPYELAHYNVEAKRWEVTVMPEPNPPLILVAVTLAELASESDWYRLRRTLDVTGRN
jgi:hypothetical protein